MVGQGYQGLVLGYRHQLEEEWAWKVTSGKILSSQLLVTSRHCRKSQWQKPGTTGHAACRGEQQNAVGACAPLFSPLSTYTVLHPGKVGAYSPWASVQSALLPRPTSQVISDSVKLTA